jgi:Holliday junction resolvase RusA-like endonuclease
MPKKKPLTAIDFQFGISEIIPATQEAYTSDGYDGEVRKEEKASLQKFRNEVSATLSEMSASLSQFPTKGLIFIFILQYFVAEKEYKTRDVDNMAKTILDLLKDRFYYDDNQVKTLLVSKKMDLHNIPQNFAYVAIKELKNDNDVEALKVAGVERSITLFQDIRSKAKKS